MDGKNQYNSSVDCKRSADKPTEMVMIIDINGRGFCPAQVKSSCDFEEWGTGTFLVNGKEERHIIFDCKKCGGRAILLNDGWKSIEEQ